MCFFYRKNLDEQDEETTINRTLRISSRCVHYRERDRHPQRSTRHRSRSHVTVSNMPNFRRSRATQSIHTEYHTSMRRSSIQRDFFRRQRALGPVICASATTPPSEREIRRIYPVY